MLDKRKHYLQIALNNTLEEAKAIVSQIPLDERIIIEVGTPLIKSYGIEAIDKIRRWWQFRAFAPAMISGKSLWLKEMNLKSKWLGNFLGPIFKAAGKEITEEEIAEEELAPILQAVEEKLDGEELREREMEVKTGKKLFIPYIVADLKCMDRGQREVAIAKKGGASAAVVLGQAPIETINAFIEECQKYQLDSMIDMMNVEFPLNVLRPLKKPPQVVILHRGVDEETFDPESEIPFHEVARIKNEYDIMVAIAGGDTFQEIQRAIFNDADIMVVWKSFYKSTSETANLAKEFLKEFR